MRRVKQLFKKLSDRQKIIILSVVFVLSIIIFIVIPSLAIFKSLNLNTSVVWDGSVASGYRSGNGSVQDPYVISNGSELAYLSEQLNSNNYQNIYFELSNDIVLNDGVFNYNADGKIEYILNNQVYYIKEYTSDYYSNSDYTGDKAGSINIFPSLAGFKGYFNGASNQIAGLYVTSESKSELALFTGLTGGVNNLKVRNALVYGGDVTGGIAGSASDADIEDILFDGFVIGKTSDLTKTLNIDISDKNINYNANTNDIIDLSHEYRFAGSDIISTTLTGTIDFGVNNPSVIIDDQSITATDFEINLGTNLKDNVAININSIDSGIVNITNLKYNITYDYTIAGGIVGKANNVTIINAVNHADVITAKVSGGLIGISTGKTEIMRSYNAGDIKSTNIAGGLIAKLENANDITSISAAFNSGNITASKAGGLIGLVIDNQSAVNIADSFDGSLGINAINEAVNSDVTIDNCYHVVNNTGVGAGTFIGSFIKTTISNLSTENFLVNEINFGKYIDMVDLNNNELNTWKFQDSQFPVLYYEDLNEAVAKIYAGTYYWDTYHADDNIVGLNNSIAFRIEPASELMPIKKVYYYIQASSDRLTKEELLAITNWQEYQDIVSINEPGYYTIYVKAVSYTNDIAYLNTDKIILDKVAPTGLVTINNVNWNTYSSNLDYIYLDQPKTVQISASDDLSGISKIKYFISDQSMSISQLNDMDSSQWVTYSEGIDINGNGINIIYVQLLDKSNNVTYINTDYLVVEGYKITNVFMGTNPDSYTGSNLIINSNSSYTTKFEYTSSLINNLDGYKHNVVTNQKLPNGTKITLIDEINHQAYQYKTDGSELYINGCDGLNNCLNKAIYPFTNFNEIGIFDTDKAYTEKDYIVDSQIDEKFTVIIDFKDSDMMNNYLSLKTWLELHDDSGQLYKPTMVDDITAIDVYNESAATLNFSSDYPMNEIIVNSNATTDINISTGLSYTKVAEHDIYDTSYENKKIGISIKMVDADGTVLNKDNMKNIIFRVDNKEYYPGIDNVVRIDLGTALTSKNKVLSIITFENNNQLTEGTYYFKINNYISADGEYFDDINNEVLSIVANIINEKADYDFAVEMPIQNRILDKTAIETNVDFSINYDNAVKQPSVKVSLYKKNLLTAYDQNYTILDLGDYTSDTLSFYAPNTYNIITNNWDLNLNTNQLDSGGYKLLFTLYDGNKALEINNKYFIVK